MNIASLKKRALKASAGELIGFAGAQALRFVSTIILSRLLFPEAFGLAALVTVFTQGLMMLSDVGIQQSVVQNERGDDPRFLNTAWTMQAVRGLLLWVVSCAMAWPMSVIYGEPELLWLLPVGTFSVVILGVSSTSFHTLRRRLAVGRLVRIELAAQAFGLAVVVPWAYFHPSVWAIVAGGLASAVFRAVAGHFVDVGYRNRFEWDPTAQRAIFSFGKWIFGSSALSFVSRQGDRLLLGHYLGMAALGVYTIAVFLSEALGTAVTRITQGVLFPLFSQIQREDSARLSELYYQARLRLDVFGLIPIGAMVVLSQTVIDIIYDPRYQEAGWMLQALCIRVAMGIVLVPLETCLSSIGHARYGFYQNIGRSLWIVIGIPLAWSRFGVAGVVWVTATSEVPVLFILWRAFHRLKLLRPSREVLAVGIFTAGIALGYVVDQAVQLTARHFGWQF